jgi:predicted acylesterase/phospholipase RssA
MADRYCDIVMKGGVTSGVVYPPAVEVIAESFVFRNIGGTSAGAIAAALTAAAEYRRARGGDRAGFTRLGGVPDWLAANSHLFRLFRPDASTAAIFAAAVGLVGRPTMQPWWLGKLVTVWRSHPAAALAGAVPGLLLLIAALWTTSGWNAVLHVVVDLAIVLFGATLGAAIALVRGALVTMPANDFGLCRGTADGPSDAPSLTPWLTAELEATAGLAPGVTPLTFGMLWDPNRAPDAAPLTAMPADPTINLEMVSTNITHGRPYSLPLNIESYLFDPVQFGLLFPKHVVDWMVAHPRPPRDDLERRRFEHYRPLLPMPRAADLPVIVATRMSLAFPLLLTAVPLHAVDYSQPANQVDLPTPSTCWWSDGGISSNFPVTLFDRPLSRWPTFGIALAGFPAGQSPSSNQDDNVWMAPNNVAGTLPAWTPVTGIPSFGSAIANAMQNWNDNTQSRVAGYRDRIVTVFLSDSEGGLNLDMPLDVITTLKQRGAAAGRKLVERFSTPSLLDPANHGMGWENHRWLRYRAAMAAVSDYLDHFADTFGNPEPPDVQYEDLIAATAGTPAAHYAFPSATVRTAAVAATKALTVLAQSWNGSVDFETGAPRPSPQLVIRPKI